MAEHSPHAPDKIHYLRIPKAGGGRAEMVRMVYTLAGRPYEDIFWTFADAAQAVGGKNPFKQFPFVETPRGEYVYQTLAIMHHAALGTSVWPSQPGELTRALSVAMGGYDLYQWFGGFSADDLAAKKKFEERRAPQFYSGLAEIYAKSPYAIGDIPTFADCIVHEAVAWTVRRNDVCRRLFEASPPLIAFRDRFESIPAIRDFMAKQAAARAADDAV